MIDAFGMTMLIFVIYTTLIVLVTLKKRSGRGKFVFVNATVMYGLMLISVTLFPAGEGAKSYSFIPFIGALMKTDAGYAFDFGIFFRYLTLSLLNVALFLPFGFLGSGYACKVGRGKRLLIVTSLSLAASLVIELLQLALPVNRVCDVDDLLFNTLGGLLGCVAFNIMMKYRSFAEFIRRNFGR